MAKEKFTVGYTESVDFRCLEDLQEDKKSQSVGYIKLDYCGKERCEKEYSFGPYIRENYVLHIVLEGKGRLFVGEKVYEIRENQAFLLVPGIETTYKADREHPWVYAWIGFHGYQSDKIVHSMGFSENNYVIDVKDASALGGYIDRMLDNSSLTYANYLKRNAFMELLFGDIIEHADVPEKEDRFSEETYVNMAVESIISNYGQPLKIAGLARQIGVNRSYLTIIFKKKMGISPQQFLMDFRMTKAAEMLTETDLPVRVISESVGYKDPLTFSKAFKLKYGTCPSGYRDNIPKLKENNAKGDYVSIHKL